MLSVDLVARRAALKALAPLLISTLPAMNLPAAAFENRLPVDELELKYKTPRTAGPKPMDIGLREGGMLKPCIDGKPHCFSSSVESFEDNDLFNADYGSTADWLIEPFKFDKPLADAVVDIKQAVAAYPPGQRGIDGGGFKVVSENLSKDGAYIYVQFESRRKGFIDDVEFSLVPGAGATPGGLLQLRSSSRLGYLDLGVNAKRINWFADRLNAVQGWRALPIRNKGHEGYFSQNSLSNSDVS